MCVERICCSRLREGDRYWIYLSSWTIKIQTKSIEWQFWRHWSPGNKWHWSLTLNRKLEGKSLFSPRLLPYENFQSLASGRQVGWILVVLLSWEESLKRAGCLEVTGHGAGPGRFLQRDHLEALLRVLPPECPARVYQEILFPQPPGRNEVRKPSVHRDQGQLYYSQTRKLHTHRIMPNQWGTMNSRIKCSGLFGHIFKIRPTRKDILSSLVFYMVLGIPGSAII